MLNSIWCSARELSFREILSANPQFAIAQWAIASTIMSNLVAGLGASPKGAKGAQAAIDEAHRIGVKAERERGYIEAIASYQ